MASYNVTEYERELTRLKTRVIKQRREYNLTEEFKREVITFFLLNYKEYGTISKIEITGYSNRKIEFVTIGDGVKTTTTIEMLEKEEVNTIQNFFNYWLFKDELKGAITLDMDKSILIYETMKEK